MTWSAVTGCAVAAVSGGGGVAHAATRTHVAIQWGLLMAPWDGAATAVFPRQRPAIRHAEDTSRGRSQDALLFSASPRPLPPGDPLPEEPNMPNGSGLLAVV